MRSLLLCLIAFAGCGHGPAGMLYLAGRDPGTAMIVDAATGEVTVKHLRQLSGGDPPYFIYATGGRVVTFALGRASSFDPRLAHPVSLGEAWYWVPSATPGRIWTIQLARRRYAFRSAREVTVDGHVVARAKAPPGWVTGATAHGLLIEKDGLFVWDPRTGARTHVPGLYPTAIRGDVVASCAVHCRALHLGGQVIRGDFLEGAAGAFSPDGTMLAVPARQRRLSLVENGRSRLVPGVNLDANYPEVAWSSTGWLFYNAGNGKLGAWRPGERARLLPSRVGPFVRLAAS